MAGSEGMAGWVMSVQRDDDHDLYITLMDGDKLRAMNSRISLDQVDVLQVKSRLCQSLMWVAETCVEQRHCLWQC